MGCALSVWHTDLRLCPYEKGNPALCTHSHMLPLLSLFYTVMQILYCSENNQQKTILNWTRELTEFIPKVHELEAAQKSCEKLSLRMDKYARLFFCSTIRSAKAVCKILRHKIWVAPLYIHVAHHLGAGVLF